MNSRRIFRPMAAGSRFTRGERRHVTSSSSRSTADPRSRCTTPPDRRCSRRGHRMVARLPFTMRPPSRVACIGGRSCCVGRSPVPGGLHKHCTVRVDLAAPRCLAGSPGRRTAASVAYARAGAVTTVSLPSGISREVYAPRRPLDPRAEFVVIADDSTSLYFKSHDAQAARRCGLFRHRAASRQAPWFRRPVAAVDAA